MNFDKLTNELSDLYEGIKNDKVPLAKAHELNATAGNINALIRLALLQAKMIGETPNLAFFNKDKKGSTRGR